MSNIDGASDISDEEECFTISDIEAAAADSGANMTQIWTKTEDTILINYCAANPEIRSGSPETKKHLLAELVGHLGLFTESEVLDRMNSELTDKPCTSTKAAIDTELRLPWTETENSLLRKFCNENPGIKYGTTEEKEQLVTVVVLTEFNSFTESEILERVNRLVAEEKEAPVSDGLTEIIWSDEEELALKNFIEANPKITSNVTRDKNRKGKLLAQLIQELERFTAEEIQIKIVDIKGKWRDQDIDEVISFYRNHHCLWNSHLADYHNKRKKASLLQQLSDQLSNRKSPSEIDAKFSNLRKTFYNITKRKPTGSAGGSQAGKKPPGDSSTTEVWPYTESMKFVKEDEQQRPSISTTEKVLSESPGLIARPASLNTSTSSEPDSAKKPRIDPDAEFKEAIIRTLDKSSTTEESFGSSVASALMDFTPLNRSFVKLRIQGVLAHSLMAQAENKSIPDFLPS